jgi:hypothetical protein
MKRNLLILLLFLISGATFGQTTYYWVGGTTAANISTAAAWNTKQDGTGTSRTAAATDVLIVDGANIGGAVATTGTATLIVNAATTAQMKIINGATVVLVRASSAGAITFANNTPGEEGLFIDATSSLEQATPGGAYTGTVNLDFPASTARIAGKLKISNGTAHRLTCRIVGGVVVTSGGSIQCNTSSYPFGNTTTSTPGTSNSINGAIVFQSGASLICEGSFSPFGSSSASVIVDFKPGSNYYVRATMTTGSFTNAKTFGNLYIQNNAVLTMDAAALNKIENLTVDAGSTLTVAASSSTQIPLTGNLVVNGSLNGTPETSSNTGTSLLIMAGNTAQTISGTGSITVSNFIVGSNSQVSLQRDLTVNVACNIYGSLLLNTYRINGTAAFTSRVGFVPSTPAATATAMTAGSYQIIVPVTPGLPSLPGLGITGTGIPEHTNIISYSSSNGQINLSKPVTITGSNVAISFGNDTATLQTALANGFGSGGSLNVSGVQNFNSGTNYIINAATANPVGISTGSTATTVSIGSLQLHADATTNINLRLSGSLYLDQSRLHIRATDTVRLTGSTVQGSFGAAAYVSTQADAVTGNKGVFRYDGITAATLLPIGSEAHYLPVTVTPAATGSGDYCVSALEGITTDATPGGTALPAASLDKTVKATWYLNRINSAGATDCNVALGWPAAIEGTAFAAAGACGIAVHNGTDWPEALAGSGVVGSKTVNADFAALSGAQALSIWLQKLNQVISFPALPAVTYGDADLTPGATSTNNNIAITYRSSNTAVATIVSGKIHITGAGTATITAEQAGDALYNEATAVPHDLVVSPAALTVTAENKTRDRGLANPVFTAVYEGFVNNETIAVLTTPVSFTTAATAASPAGIYDIVPAGGVAANYTITYINGKLTVTAPDLIDQAISFPVLAAVTYGVADITPGATSTNTTIPITYSSGNTAAVTVVNGKLHITGTGTAVITAAQAGDDTYNPAPEVTQSITVNAAPLKIAADNQTRNQGVANPTFTFTYTGFVNNETSAVLTAQPQASTTAGIGSPAGTYPITVSSAAAANYIISYQEGVLTVNAFTQQVISFPALPAKTYGAADFSTGATSNNATIAITYTSSNTNVATVSNGTIHITGAGFTTITASQAGNANYGVATDVPQQLTVDKAPLVIKADDQSKYVGQANPVLTYTATGWVNNETSQVLTSQPAVITTVVTNSPAGPYQITASGAAATNYAISYTPGVLTVKPLIAQVISFAALPVKTYGEADFSGGAASSNSTLPVTYSSSNTSVATIVAGNIHITGTGTAVITASQAGNEMYAAAASVPQTLTVNKAVVTIAADNKIKTEGQANPVLTVSYSGLVNNETASVLTTAPVVTTGATVASVAGVYPITTGGAAATNYSFVYVPGTLTVYAKEGAEHAALEVLGNKTNLQVRVYVTVPVIGAVQLFDSYGRLQYLKKVYLPKGFTNVTVPAATAKPGIYIITVTGTNLKLSRQIGLL